MITPWDLQAFLVKHLLNCLAGTPNTIDIEGINLPLETFVIKRDNFYRLRIINVGMLFGFRVSVDKVNNITRVYLH